jgi:hypothetical protein
VFVRNRDGRLARVTDLIASTIQAWMDDMAAEDLALSTMRVRQSTVSSLCAWLVKPEILTAHPGSQTGAATTPSRAAKTSPGIVDHGRARGSREAPPPAA